VIAWVGTAIWAAFALGAPAGSTLYASYGFTAIALATVLIPLASLLLVAPHHPVMPASRIRPAFTRVIGAIWVPCIGMALSGVGFGAITTFISLRFVERGWSPVWLAFSAFAGAFILARLVCGHLPDRLGGAKVALVSVLIEAAGQALIWLAGGPAVALAGTVLTGIGWSLVYPSFGIEAVHRAPPESRSLAMGAYTAFLDVSIGLTGPALGVVASGLGLGTVFLVSAVVVLGSAFIAVRLLSNPAAAR
jgi:MFS family permease